MRRTIPMVAACALLLAADAPASEALLLELRVFDGAEEVTSFTRLTVHRAGEREAPLAQAAGRDGPIELRVPEGIYDVQAIQERDGRVVNIKWAHRLVVMRYPDERGRHLEVVNFQEGYGALQVRAEGAALPEVRLEKAGEPAAPAPARGAGYLLFVAPAGHYDVTVTHGDRRSRHEDVEVPRDRTRLWMIPPRGGDPRSQTRRPESSRSTITTSAMTSRTWIRPPTTSSANPSSHSTTRIATMVHSMDNLLLFSLSPAGPGPSSPGRLQSGYRPKR